MVVEDADGVVWSFAKEVSNDGEHFVASNAFARSLKRAREVAINKEQVSSLAKVGLRGLLIIADALDVPSEMNELALATSLANKVNSLVPLSVPVQEPPRGANLPAPPPPVLAPGTDPDRRKVPELRLLARDLGIRTGSLTKPELIAKITEARAITGQELEAMRTSLKAASKGGPRLLHDKYVSVFNGVDLHDRHWYAAQNHHSVHSWRAKFVLSLLISGVINTWVVYKHFEDISLIDFFTSGN